MPTKKNPLISKTIWSNLILAVAAFFPVVQDYLAQHPMLIADAFAVVNIVLRAVTKDALSFKE